MKTTLKSTALSALFAIGLAGAGLAATDLDANGDGLVTLDEMNTAYPEIEASQFSAMDVNADGVLDSSEVAAAQDAGILPKT